MLREGGFPVREDIGDGERPAWPSHTLACRPESRGACLLGDEALRPEPPVGYARLARRRRVVAALPHDPSARSLTFASTWSWGSESRTGEWSKRQRLGSLTQPCGACTATASGHLGTSGSIGSRAATPRAQDHDSAGPVERRAGSRWGFRCYLRRARPPAPRAGGHVGAASRPARQGKRVVTVRHSCVTGRSTWSASRIRVGSGFCRRDLTHSSRCVPAARLV